MSDIPSRYLEFYRNPKGPGDSRPTAQQIINDLGAANSLTGKTILITGVTSGIGLETLRALHTTGAGFFVMAQDLADGQRVADDIIKFSEGKGKIDVIQMEMKSLDSVKKAAKVFLAKSDKLHILVNNAGVMGMPTQVKTDDGFEQQFGINHLAHFALTALVLPLLLSSSSPTFNSRVINVGSTAHRYSPVNFDDVNLTDKYDPWIAYGQSKTANIWTANHLDRLYGRRGVHAYSVFPGLIWTPLLKHLPAEMETQWKTTEKIANTFFNADQGAANTVWAAVSPTLEGKGGKFLALLKESEFTSDTYELVDPGNAAHTYDQEGEKKLWEKSQEWTGIKVDV